MEDCSNCTKLECQDKVKIEVELNADITRELSRIFLYCNGRIYITFAQLLILIYICVIHIRNITCFENVNSYKIKKIE